ncbi:MAG TPA: S8 family serine peptidase [Isosphaeraceae bacterium]|jgi:subtilisin family serine protease|nr:S8 family serine peptidase [Isosphaeraceae bacterium]
MRRTTRRAPASFSLEVLESRSLLSIDPATSILVGLATGASAASVQTELASLGGHIVESFPNGPSVVTLSPGVNRAAVLNTLRSDPHFRYAEADGTLHAADTIPNDPRFAAQWGLSNGDNVDIDAPQAWDITTGSPSTIVAVLDSGIDVANPDFAGRLWTNPVDGSHGWNFITNTSNIQDDDGHGTHVAGILAATGNNGIGVAGVNWQAQIMALKIIDGNGNGSTDAAVTAIYFAAQHGARVINASWDGPDYSQAMFDAISYAGSLGVVFVAAAGNETANNDLVPSYPASYHLPNLISVAAVDASGALADFSNFGTSVDLAAPGVGILSTVPGGFATFSGTSMATPFVSGVVSLVLGVDPSLTSSQVVQQVLANVKPLPSLAGRTLTGGMVDAFQALAGLPITADFTKGIAKSALTLERPSAGEWSISNPSTGGTLQSAQFGEAGSDIAVPADYGGTGKLDYAVFRPSTAQWFIQGPTGGRVIQFGSPGDIPVPGDYDGDGRADIAVFRPSNATWYILGSSSGPYPVQFGQANHDLPVPGDYDGDGRTDLAVYRPDTAQWFIKRSSLGPLAEQFGPAGRGFPVPADYDGDGKTDVAVFDPTTSYWYILRSTAGYEGRQFGPAGQSIPVPGDYDNDGVTDLAVYQPATSQWYVSRSSAGPYAQQFGQPGLDIPAMAPIEYRIAASGYPIFSSPVRTAAVMAPPAQLARGSLRVAVAPTPDPGPDLVPLVASAGLLSADLLLAGSPAHESGKHASRSLHDAALEVAMGEVDALRARGLPADR